MSSELLKDCSLSLCLLLAEDNSFPASNPKLSSWSWCQKEMIKSFSAFLYNCLTVFSSMVIYLKKSNKILNIPVNVCPLFLTGAVVWVPGVWCMDPTHNWQQKHDGSILKRLIEESLIKSFFVCFSSYSHVPAAVQILNLQILWTTGSSPTDPRQIVLITLTHLSRLNPNESFCQEQMCPTLQLIVSPVHQKFSNSTRLHVNSELKLLSLL